MVIRMKMKLSIHAGVMSRLREEAARRGVTMSALVEAGLRRMLDEAQNDGKTKENLPEIPSWSGGRDQVDVSNRGALYAVMEEG